ncbi:UNVERIFIED_CONTAM: hypothetical protein FKN15_058663 [Acipenser sinensis]
MNEMERAENGASLLALSIDVNENEQNSTSYSSFTVCKSGKPALLLNENKKPGFSEDTNSVLSGKGYVYIASERNVNDDKAALGDNNRLDCVSDSECLPSGVKDSCVITERCSDGTVNGFTESSEQLVDGSEATGVGCKRTPSCSSNCTADKQVKKRNGMLIDAAPDSGRECGRKDDGVSEKQDNGLLNAEIGAKSVVPLSGSCDGKHQPNCTGWVDPADMKLTNGDVDGVQGDICTSCNEDATFGCGSSVYKPPGALFEKEVKVASGGLLIVNKCALLNGKLELHNNPAKCICETAAVSDVQIKKLLEPALEDGFNKGFCPEDDDFGTTGVAPSETTVVSECCDPFPKITTTISGALDIENMGPKDETLVPNESNVKEDDEYEARTGKTVNLPPQSGRRKNLEFEPLSTTALILEDRPANLPAKSTEEALRHRHEYESMVAEAKKREMKDAHKKKKIMKERYKQEEVIANAMVIWNSEILPNWETMRNTRKVRELWWQGLPPSVRGKVWSLAVGNELNITHELYEIFLSRAKERWKSFSETGSENEAEDSGTSGADRESSLDLIKLDISRTFPSLFIFQKGGPYHDLLHSVLGAYTCYRPDVGYVQGMSFIAAVLILNLEEADAFILFANLLNKPCQMAFFRVDHDLMLKYFAAFEVFFEENLPRLFVHFKTYNLTPDIYLIDWIFTLYSKSLPLDLACRVWDVFCRDGEEFLFRTGLGILKLYEDILLQMDFIHIAQFLTKLPEDITSEKLFNCIAAVQMLSSNKKWTQRKSKKKAPSFRKLLKTSNIKIENKLKNRQFKQQSIAKKHRKEQKKLKQALSNAATRTPLPLERYKKRPEDEEDEEEFEETLPVDMMEEDDLEQMKAMAQKASFLTRDLSSSEPVHARKHKQENVMDKYEKVPRLMQKEQEKELIHLLPIKDKTGIIPQTMEKPVVKKAEKENEDEGDGDGAEEVNAPKPLPLLTTQELVVLRRRRLEERKVCIAALGSSILSDPSANIKKLKELRSMLVELDPYVAVTVRKLVMVSLMEIFKDIVPSYRIRPLTEAEKSTKVKKETQQLREFEEGLVSQYKFYLENLEQTVKDWKQMKKKKSDVVSLTSYKGLAEVAVKCLCELLVALPHFNFHNNIIVMIVPLMNHDCKKVLKALLCLRVKEVEVKKDADDIAPKKRFMNFKEKRKHLSRMQRKWKKAEEKLEKELLEAEATECKEKKLKLHTETLNIVFLTYFRILKKAQKSILLPCVLEGLAKFAHLINVEFFDDLLIVLHKLVESGDLSYRESLHCIQTAFHVLSGQGDVLNIDPLKFYTHLYKTLLRLHAGTANDDMIIVLQCLDVMLTKRRKQVSVQRALAFIKRLTTLSLQVLPNSTIGILATNRVLMHTFPKSDILLDNESQGSGIYLPELDEPEYCNPQNTSLWELHTLQRHYHPIVRKFAAHLIVGAPSEGSGALNVDLSRKSATDLFEDYSIKGMTFNPPVATPSSKKKEEEDGV